LALLKAQVLVTGFCPPWVEERLRKMDIRVVNGFKGTVRDALTKAEKLAGSAARGNEPVEMSWFKAFAMAGRQLQAMLPVFVGIILLVGLLREIATPRTLQLLFTGDFVSDAIWGALVGSVITGQPLNSYVIADQLLEQNVSLVGATALLAAWVNVGVAQLPLEVKALGLKFALARNSLGFLFSLVMAWSMGALHLFWPWGMEAL
jgi:uncharacterized membrane protein YraQ (UPF0718 family)